MKKAFAIVAGVIAGFAIVFMGKASTDSLSPLPNGLNFMNRDDMMRYILSIPMYVLILKVVFWLASSFLGAMLAARVNRAEWKSTALITGIILLGSAILNMAINPHPTWIWISALVGYLPLAFFGGWLVRPKSVSLPQ